MGLSLINTGIENGKGKRMNDLKQKCRSDHDKKKRVHLILRKKKPSYEAAFSRAGTAVPVRELGVLLTKMRL